MEIRKKMLALVMAVFLGISMVGCSGKSVGPITIDGQIDIVEAQIIQYQSVHTLS